MLNETVWTTGEDARFSARTVAALSSDRVLDSKDGTRPLLFAVLADAGAARPIAACVRLRGELSIGDGGEKRYTLLRSAGYRQTAQYVQAGSATILQWCLPGYFELDPGARADGAAADEGEGTALAAGAAAFVVMPAAADLAREVAARDPVEVVDVIDWLARDTTVFAGRYGSGEERFKIPSPSDPPYLQTGAPVARAALAEAIAWAPLLAAYVDRRVTSPMLRDLRYQALLLCALIERGSASWPSSRAGWGHVHGWSNGDLSCRGVDDLGWASPLVVAPREVGTLDALVVECVRGYEGARRGGRDGYARAVLAAQDEHATRLAQRKAAAAARK